MKAIYKGAAHVLVWLGDDPLKEAKDAFEFVKSLDETLLDDEAKAKFRVRWTDELHEQSAKEWAPLEHLTKNPYVS